MPRISLFYGISITMRFREHGLPHFHATYGDATASIGINPLAVLTSSLQPRQLGLVMEWAALHQADLELDWNRAQSGELPLPIEPLP